MTPDWISLKDLADSLANDDSIPREVTEQVFNWFGKNLGEGKWKLEVQDVVKEIGKAVLSEGKVRVTILYHARDILTRISANIEQAYTAFCLQQLVEKHGRRRIRRFM